MSNEKHVFQRGGRIYDQMCGLCSAVADAPIHQMGDIQRAAARVHCPTGKEITVESALAELREMFPGEAVSIEYHDYSGIKGCEGNGYVRASSATGQYEGASLSEAMDGLRAERKSK